MSPDEQEALSRRYSDDIIMLLPLASGNGETWAVFNSARELCGLVNPDDAGPYEPDWDFWTEVEKVWHPPKPAPTATKPDVDLKDLELL